jgi:hypothetical protein
MLMPGVSLQPLNVGSSPHEQQCEHEEDEELDELDEEHELDEDELGHGQSQFAATDAPRSGTAHNKARNLDIIEIPFAKFVSTAIFVLADLLDTWADVKKSTKAAAATLCQI